MCVFLDAFFLLLCEMRFSEKFYIYRQRERHENTFLTLVKKTLLTYITDSANNPNSSDLYAK